MQEQDFEWFKQNYKELFQKYGHKYLAIKNKRVLGVYDSFALAVKTTRQTEKEGTFIVQECGEDESCYTHYKSW